MRRIAAIMTGLVLAVAFVAAPRLAAEAGGEHPRRIPKPSARRSRSGCSCIGPRPSAAARTMLGW
jgi:hypothetical protein